ncbi:unnamed protein product [Orchesella dallaii]|uniref:E3 ubiquitin-protein ligase TRIM71 n=1 Tax=Orchesella dallaii TaxID=48710 RepID=A0ABP1QGJ6_9HEXA
MDKSSYENLVVSSSSFPTLPSSSATTTRHLPGINQDALQSSLKFPADSIDIPIRNENFAGYFLTSSLPKYDTPASTQHFFGSVQPSLSSDRINDPLFLNVFCDQPFYFVNSLVTFTIGVQNLPMDAKMDSESFQVTVTSPNGKREQCLLELGERDIIGTSFNGSFWSANDAGLYEINISITIQPANDREILRGSLSIPVSRQYDEDSKNEFARIYCEYKTLDQRTRYTRRSSIVHRVASNNHGNWQQRNQCKLWGITSDLRTNNIYYTDRNSHTVVCASLEGHTLLKFGEFGNEPGKLFRPTGIAYDDEHGRLLVVDKDNHRVCFYSMNGQYISSFGMNGHENGAFNYPWDVDVSRNGQHIAVSDSRNKRVQLFDRFGNFLNKYSVFERNPFEYKDQLEYPRGITFDETGNNIYVTDFNVHNVIKVPLDCSHHHKMIPDGKLCRPQGITVDGIGNLLIADTNNHYVRHVTPKSDLISNISNVHKCSIEFPMNVTTVAGRYVAALHGNGKISIF